MDDLAIMRRAIELGRAAGVAGNLPFGAVVTRDGDIVSEASNTVATSGDPTAHAELDAIRQACKAMRTADLTGLRIFSSGEPCPMCLTAIYWSRLSELVYGSSKEDAARVGLATASLYEELSRHPDDRRLASRRLAEHEARTVVETYGRSAGTHEQP